MKKLMDRVDKFCYRNPNFGIPSLMKYIAIGNALFWVLQLVSPGILNYLTFSPKDIFHGQIWRIVSFVFYPPSTSWLALIAVYFYYWIGTTLEREWGTARFTVYFFTGVVLTEVCGLLMYVFTRLSVPMTAEYIYLSMFFSFAVLFPDMQVLLFFIIPVKMKWLGILNGVFFLISTGEYVLDFLRTGYVGYLIVGLVPLVAVLNFLLFCGGDLLRNRPRRPTRTTVNFRNESARIRREQATKLYNHKCAVCGKTDTDYPTLEFRYCSRCAGYHCFCSEHINNHIHFSE